MPQEHFVFGDLEPLTRCLACEWWRPAGAPDCRACFSWIVGMLDRAWANFLRHEGLTDEEGLAELIVAEVERHEWEVVEAAYRRVTCEACGCGLSAGPVGCSQCDMAHGFRYAARETDRPGADYGNEHALRVAVSAVLVPHRIPPYSLTGFRISLPLLLAGQIPNLAQARHTRALVEKSRERELGDAMSFGEMLSIPL